MSSVPAPMSISSKLATRDNNLNAIRLIAATLVLFSHCYPLTGNIQSEPIARYLHIFDGGAIAVIAFFFLSGYLISASWAAAPSLPSFMLKRVLRILPALAVVATLSALVLGPLMSSLDTSHYFDSSQAFKYIRDNINVLNLRTNTLPGVFENLPVPQAINGSLWTLRTEFWVYIGTGIIGVTCLLPTGEKRIPCAAFAVVALIVAARLIVMSKVEFDAWRLPLDYFSYRLMAAYLIGTVAFVIRGWLIRSWLILAALAALAWLAKDLLLFQFLIYIAFAYFLLLIATAKFSLLGKSVRTQDYSYGAYIYAFPVQQTIAALVPGIAPLTMFSLAVPIVFVFAASSWHLVEKPALGLKNLPFRFKPRPSAGS